MKLNLTLVATAAAIVAAPASAATIVVYTSQSAFEAATGPNTVEDFADTTLVPGLSITAVNFNNTAGKTWTISGGKFNDNFSQGNQRIHFDLGGSKVAFGGIFDTTPPINTGGISLSVTFADNTTQNIFPGIDNSCAGCFFGFTSDVAFSRVSLRRTLPSGTSGQERYTIDSLQFAAAVPEPATWAMMIGGFGMVGGAMRSARRRTKVSYAAA